MRRIVILITAVLCLSIPVHALEFHAPEAPDSVENLVPKEADSFGEGLWNVLKAALEELDPGLRESASLCLQITAALLLCSLVEEFAPSVSKFSMRIAASAAVAAVLLSASTSMIHLGEETVVALSSYGKLLLPVMTGVLAAQGGATSSTALYAGTAFFDALLSGFVSNLLIPMVWLYLALAIGHAALDQELLGKMKELLKWLISWGLKLVLYVFTGYMTVSGVVSGTADAAAVKAAKIAISGAVPVVGGILSDATETVLVSAGALGSAAGIYGLLTVVALFTAPFLKLGIQYLLLKATAALTASFGGKNGTGLVADFSSAMGLILAMVSTQTVLLLISTVCFMKGVG